ncbi:MAG: cold-shock protein [Actinomycetota bacterium]|nr:cold-shock protein [Actinomycetota bacterium]
MAEKNTGTVKWFDEERCYGFIAPHEGGPAILVHPLGIAESGTESLSESKKVSYEVVQGRRGLQAENVSVEDG